MSVEEERSNMIDAIEHLERLAWATTDATEIADYTRQIVRWRQKLAELERPSDQVIFPA
jgi:hypothetical protein